MLKEYVSTQHWDQRVTQRIGDSIEIIYPNAIFENVPNKEELKAALDENIKKIIRARILAYQVLQDSDPSKYVSTVIVSIQLKKDNQLFTPMFKVNGGEGNVYIGLTHNNTLITLLVVPKEKCDPNSLTQRTISHMKAQGVNISEEKVEIKTTTNPNSILDVNSVLLRLSTEKDSPIGVPKTPNDLPYKVKKDYKKSTPGRPNFITYNGLGRGEIIGSEQGMGGKWNNVAIKFPIGIKTFKTLYSNDFF